MPYLIDTHVTKPVKLNIKQHSSLENLKRSPNRLIIPALQVEEAIYEGPDAATLNKGVWHRPLSSTPGQGSNTVLAGHRFTYNYGESAFSRLDKLKLGDPIVVVYESHVYRYIVRATQVVKPTATYIEDPTSTTQLTLYTCTPLWSYSDRLVYQASLEEKL